MIMNLSPWLMSPGLINHKNNKKKYFSFSIYLFIYLFVNNLKLNIYNI